MYRSTKFKAKDQAEVLDFMTRHPFITLIGYDGEFPVATQVPVQCSEDQDGHLVLHGHMMKNTDHHVAFVKNPNALALFVGPHTYVSASVYTQPASASTWNYMTVHAKGNIQFLDAAGTYEAIKNLTNQYENPTSSPAAFHHMTEEYIQKLLPAIAGFELTVKSLEHVFKLSQNHPQENRDAIVANLSGSDDADAVKIADAMKD
jgi:transcriptional regulator